MENVGRSGAVTASAIIALLGSVVMGLGGIVLLLSLAALRLPVAQQAMAQSPPQPVSPELMVGGMAAGALALMVWGVASAVAILRGRPWGRVSFLAFGGMLAVFGTINVFGTALVALVFSRAALPDPNVPRGLMVGMMGGMALACAVAAGLGIWWRG